MHRLPIDEVAGAGRRRPRIGRRTLPAVVLAAGLAAVALPSAAQAGVADFSNGTLVYSDTSSPNQRNDVTVRPANGKIMISDTGPISSNTSQCKVFNGELECDAATQLSIFLGAGDDVVRYRVPQPGTVQLGAGNDRVFGGIRLSAGRAIDNVGYVGQDGYDVMDYSESTAGVGVEMADNLPNDGRPGIDRENVMAFEHLNGSNHRDTLFGTPNRDAIAGGLERDIIAGGAGEDYFYSGTRDGADDYHGGPGSDHMIYIGRTQPLTVQLDNVATDGEAGEFDNVQSNVENIYGGSAGDTFRSFSAFSRLEGFGGADTLEGGDGSDTLIGGEGGDALVGGSGTDVVDARDDNPDFVDCGTEVDSLSRDIGEGVVRNCETVQVGVLRLADKTIEAEAGKPAPVELSWRHPDGWRKLRTVTLRLMSEQQAVGEVVIRPRGGRVSAEGFAKLARGARLTQHGKTVTAKLGLRIDPAMAGRKLDLEVEATDTRGRRQLERAAGTIRVAR
jgi:hypothetical protein